MADCIDDCCSSKGPAPPTMSDDHDVEEVLPGASDGSDEEDMDIVTNGSVSTTNNHNNPPDWEQPPPTPVPAVVNDDDEQQQQYVAKQGAEDDDDESGFVSGRCLIVTALLGCLMAGIVLLVIFLTQDNDDPTFRDLNIDPPILQIEYANARYGEHVHLTRDGTKLVFSNYNAQGDFVLEQWMLQSASAKKWTPLGSFVAGTPGLFFNQVAMSGDGNTIAISLYPKDETEFGGRQSRTVLVFTNNNSDTKDDSSSWTQIANLTADSLELKEFANVVSFGEALSLSFDGRILAVGAPTASYGDTTDMFRHGAVRVFERRSTTTTNTNSGYDNYVPLGSTLIGNEYDYLGTDVQLSQNGRRLVVGAPGFVGDTGGHVDVYDYKTDDDWVQKYTIAGSVMGTFFGGSLAINDDATRIAVGAYSAESLVLRNATLQVYQETNNNNNGGSMAAPLGSSLPGGLDGTGYSMALSGNGNFWAVNNANGQVQVYEYNNNDWTPHGPLLGGGSTAFRPKNPVSLGGGDQPRLALGLPERNVAQLPDDVGDVQVFQLK